MRAGISRELGMVPPYGHTSRKIPHRQPYSRAILISPSCALCVPIGDIFIRVAEPQLLQVPRHSVLSQVRSSEPSEGMERLAALQLHIPANLFEAVAQNIVLGKRSAGLG